MSSKVLAIIKREFITRARTKGFIIGTLLLPAIFVFFIGGIFIFMKYFQPSTKEYYVVDQTGRIYEEFVSSISDTLSTGEPKYIFTKKTVSNDGLDAAVEGYVQEVLRKEIDGYLVIPEDVVDKRRVRYSALSVANFEEQERIGNILSRLVTNIRLENKGFSPEEVREEFKNVRIVSSQVTEEGEVSKSGVGSFFIAYLLGYLMLIMTMIWGGILMRSVIEEKSQRIAETIVSTIKPMELMIGKILGICSLGLVQLIVMSTIIFVVSHNGESILLYYGVTIPDVLDLVRSLNLSGTVLFFFISFYILGYFLFATMFAAVGAIVNSEDEGQQFQMPIMFLMMIAFFIMISANQNPDTTMAFWASLVPFFTPIVMFGRVAVSDPQVPSGAYLSLASLAGSVVFMIWFVAKIYRVGILMYGKKPSIKEIIKWIRYS